VTNKELRANHYQHPASSGAVYNCMYEQLLFSEFKHTGRWPVSMQNLRVCKGPHKLQISGSDSGRSASLWRPAIHVSGLSWYQDFKQIIIGRQNFISYAFLVENM